MTYSLYVTFFERTADRERVAKCARMAAMHHEIAAMPMGYETLCGDLGTTLSGGQRQRVLLARALYRYPKMLVLDEATSNLDAPTERVVSKVIAGLPQTRIIIAHRPETIVSARRVVTLDGGQIAADVSLRPQRKVELQQHEKRTEVGPSSAIT